MSGSGSKFHAVATACNASTSASGDEDGSSGVCATCGDGDEVFPRAVAKIAVSQICSSLGFHSIQRSALDAIADIAVLYLVGVGKLARYYANLAGRTQCNALDVILALEDLGTGIDARASAEMGLSLSVSGTLNEVMRFVEYGEEIPFAKPLPHFPVCKKRTTTPSYSQLGEKPQHPHIPSWLPVFPDPHTYISMSLRKKAKRDPRMDKLEQAIDRQTSKAPSLDHGFLPSISPPPPSAIHGEGQGVGVTLVQTEGVDCQGKGKARQPCFHTQNPCFAPLLLPEANAFSTFLGERLSIPRQRMKGVTTLSSVLEDFAPAIETVANGFEQPYGGSKLSQGSALPDSKNRAPILLTFGVKRTSQKSGTDKLSLVADDVCPAVKDGKKQQWVYMEEEEKKRSRTSTCARNEGS
eukprot:c23717_g1_i1 orf=259-1488(+)